MRICQKVVILSICMIFAAVAPACADMVDRTVGNVNGQIILYSDVLEQIKMLEKVIPNLSKDLEDPAKKPLIEHDVLLQIIRQKLAEEEVKRLKINVSSSEVDQQIQQIIQENHATPEQFEKVLKQSDQTMEKYRDGVKKELERNRLMERAFKNKIVITDEQVEAYLKGEKGASAVLRQQVRLGMIFLPADEKKKAETEKTGREIIEKLKGGADFHKMATEYSKGPAASEGGDVGYISSEELAPFIAQAIKDLKSGETTGLVPGPNGYYLFKVFDMKRQVQSTSDPALREKVRTELYQKEASRRFDEWVRDLESKAFIQTSL